MQQNTIDYLSLSDESLQALKRLGVQIIQDLVRLTPHYLLLKGIRPRQLREIRKVLRAYGLQLAVEPEKSKKTKAQTLPAPDLSTLTLRHDCFEWTGLVRCRTSAPAFVYRLTTTNVTDLAQAQRLDALLVEFFERERR